MGFPISTGSAGHGEIRHLFNNCGNSEVKKIGSQIGDLHSRRIEADYRLHKKNIENRKTAEALVKQTARMISILDAHCFGSDRPNIISAIKEYQKSTRQRL